MSTSVFRPGDRPLLNLALLGLTALTTFGAFYIWWNGGLRGSAIFSACVLLILGSHEMGHYLLARYHRVDTSLPYFIPLPLPGFGTLGAVIQIRDRIPNKNALVDIGGAGPLAGLIVALPILIYGLLHSPPSDTVPPTHWPSSSSVWALTGHVVDFVVARWHGHSLPASPEPRGFLFGDNLLTLGLKRVFLGPLPLGKDIHEHPAYIAGWFGLLVTMLNLIPVGQTDGGHLTHAWFGERARAIGRAMGGFMLGLCLFASASWIVWMVVTTAVVGFKHPEVVDPEVRLTPARKWVCLACGIALMLCLMPLPMQVLEG